MEEEERGMGEGEWMQNFRLKEWAIAQKSLRTPSDRHYSFRSLSATEGLSAQHLGEPLYGVTQAGTGDTYSDAPLPVSSDLSALTQSGNLHCENPRLKLPDTGTSASASASVTSSAEKTRGTKSTSESIPSDAANKLSSKTHLSLKKHPAIFRAILKKKNKGNQPSVEELGCCATDQRDLDANFSTLDLMMKRCASPTLPEGATQPKSEPPVCNGESNSEGHSGIVSKFSIEHSNTPTTARQETCAETSGVMEVEAVSAKAASRHSNINRRFRKDSAVDTFTKERIAIIDFGAQYGKVIDRRVREKNIMGDMLPLSTKASEIVDKGYYKGIIISGGPNSVNATNAPLFDPALFTCGLPVLGICYGFQLINKAFGGSVTSDRIREDGQAIVDIDRCCCLFHGLSEKEKVLLTHGDSVTELTVADGFKIIAKSGRFVAGIADDERKIYGVQFHPEVDLTVNGKKIFENFLYKIAGCSGSYTIRNREEICIEEIQKTVGDKHVLVLVSGGVDSTVCAALLNKALGKDRVTALHIDNGFMRYEESDNVIRTLAELGLPVRRFNAHFHFLSGMVATENFESDILSRTTNPEIKRMIIGDTFMRVKDAVLEEMGLNNTDLFLCQGTLRPDLIESSSALASDSADTIKTHHNDTALVRELRDLGKVIEPLKDFHKDEVRELGEALGLPKSIIHRHPFPGPGLAVRILCADRPYIMKHRDRHLELQNYLRAVANLARDEDEKELHQVLARDLSREELATLFNHRAEIGATLLPIQSVGVQGDSRSYSYVAALSTDERPIPWDVMEVLARVIPRFFRQINRVVYVFGSIVEYPVNSITRTYLNEFTVSLLRYADHLATQVLNGLDEDGNRDIHLEVCVDKVQQMPVVMVPVHFDRNPNDRKQSCLRSFVLRPFLTSDFMTGLAALPGRDLPEETVLEMARRIQENVPLTSRVMIDLTSKPPGTTEWE